MNWHHQASWELLVEPLGTLLRSGLEVRYTGGVSALHWCSW